MLVPKLCKYCVRFEVLMVVTMRTDVFYDVTPCSHVEVDCNFSGFCCPLHSDGEKNYPDVRGSRLVHLYQPLHHVPEDSK